MLSDLLEGMVAAGRIGEFEARMRSLGELLKQQPGLDRGALLSSLAYPAKYTRMMRFLSREAVREWARSGDLANFLE